MPNGRKLLKLVLGTLGTVVGLVLIELTFQVAPRSLLPKEFRILDRAYTGRVKWTSMMTGDPYLGYRYKPDLDVAFPSEGRSIRLRTLSYGLGEIGFRDIGAQPPFDAIAIGDSFTFCDDVNAESCWVKQVAERTGRSIATLGVSGFSNLAEARVLERYGRQLKPRLVILEIYANDFNDNIDFDAWARSNSDNFWQWRGEREGRSATVRWWADRSIIVRAIDGLLRTRGRYTYKYKKDGLNLVFYPAWLEAMTEEGARERLKGWELMREALLQIKKTTDEIGAKLVVVLVPTKEEVYWDVVRDDLPSTAFSPDSPYADVRQFCDQERIPYCDLAPGLMEVAKQKRQLYLPISNHWNDLGNIEGGRLVAECLEQKQLMPRKVANTTD